MAPRKTSVVPKLAKAKRDYVVKQRNLIFIHSVIFQALIPQKEEMDLLREFLESSTIHGLTYISSAKVREVYLKRLYWATMKTFVKDTIF